MLENNNEIHFNKILQVVSFARLLETGKELKY